MTARACFFPLVAWMGVREFKLCVSGRMVPAESLAALVRVEEKIVSGDARESLCEAAKKSEVDMLVVRSHGYRPVKRLNSFVLMMTTCSIVLLQVRTVQALNINVEDLRTSPH
ncbi:hypothetical protein KI387_028365, partial [Taxus chinensis]